MTDFDERPVPRRVTEEQLAESRGEFGLLVAVLVAAGVYSVGTANAPAALLVAGLLAVTGVAGIRREREPSRHLAEYTDPIAAEIVRVGHLEPRTGEDRVALAVRVVDTLDLLRPRWSLRGWSRRLAAASALIVALRGVGLLGDLPWGDLLPGLVIGNLCGFGMIGWPKRRRAAEAVALLEAQLEELTSLPAGAAVEVDE